MGLFSKKFGDIIDIVKDAKQTVENSEAFGIAKDIKEIVCEDVSEQINKNVKRAKKFKDDNPEYFEVAEDIAAKGKKKVIATYSGVKEVVVAVANMIVDLFFIREQVKKKNPGTIRAIILEKKKNAVNVGIFDSNETVSQHMIIESDYGFSDNVVRGETFDIYV